MFPLVQCCICCATCSPICKRVEEFKALLHKVLSASDVKKHARTFMEQNASAEKIYDDVEKQINAKGSFVLHAPGHDSVHVPPGDDVDLYLAGFPCQAFTFRCHLRHMNGCPGRIHFHQSRLSPVSILTASYNLANLPCIRSFFFLKIVSFSVMSLPVGLQCSFRLVNCAQYSAYQQQHSDVGIQLISEAGLCKTSLPWQLVECMYVSVLEW